jgi:hypothetical protein
MYATGPRRSGRGASTADIIWHVLGLNSISDSHCGLDQVIDCFERRRGLTNVTMRVDEVDLQVELVGPPNSLSKSSPIVT